MDPNDPRAAGNSQPLRPCNKEQLTQLLGVSRYVLNHWIDGLKEKLGPIKGNIFSVNQVKILVDTYGLASPEKYLKRA